MRGETDMIEDGSCTNPDCKCPNCKCNPCTCTKEKPNCGCGEKK